MKPEVMTSTAVVEATTRGEIDVQISTAKQYPRDIDLFRRRSLELMTSDKEIAEECFYALPRDGKTIFGPSVRAAEIIASCWGNLRVAARVLEVGEKTVTCSAACHDLESNVAVSIEVQRRITNRQGRRYSDDMVVTTGKAGCAVAFRDAVLKLVPKAMWNRAYDAAFKMASKKERTTFDTRRRKALDWFKNRGVSRDQLLSKLGVTTVKSLTEDHLTTLRGYVNEIQEDIATIDELFGAIEVKKPKMPAPMKEKGPWDSQDTERTQSSKDSKTESTASGSISDLTKLPGQKTSSSSSQEQENSQSEQKSSLPAPPKETPTEEEESARIEKENEQDWKIWLTLAEHLPAAAMTDVLQVVKTPIYPAMKPSKLKQAIARANYHLGASARALIEKVESRR